MCASPYSSLAGVQGCFCVAALADCLLCATALLLEPGEGGVGSLQSALQDSLLARVEVRHTRQLACFDVICLAYCGKLAALLQLGATVG